MFSFETFSSDLNAKYAHLSAIPNLDGSKTDKIKEYNGWATLTASLLREFLEAHPVRFEYAPVLDGLGQNKSHNEAQYSSSARDTLFLIKATIEKLPATMIDNETQFDEVIESIETARTRCQRFKSVYESWKRTLEIAPEVNVENRIDMIDSPTESEDEFIGVIRKRKQRAKKKKTSKRLVAEIPLPKAELKESDLVYMGNIKEDGSVLEDDWRFPSRSYKIGWFKTPQQNAPYIGTKRVKIFELSESDRKKVEWKPFAPATYYKFSDCDPDLLFAMKEEGFFPTAIYSDAISHAIPNLHMTATPTGIPENEAVGKIDQHYLQTAELIFWWGQIEKLLKKNGKESKLPFFNKWCIRLVSMPEQFANATPDVVKKLFSLLRFNMNETAALNKTMRGFITGMLASWKAGETRETYLERAAASVNCFWGEYASNYVRYWSDQEWNKATVKPAHNSIVNRLFTRIKAKSERIVAETKTAIASQTDLAAATVEQVIDDARAIANATEHLSAWQKAKAHASYFGGRVGKYWSDHLDTSNYHWVEDGKHITLEGKPVTGKVLGVLRATIGIPFFFLDRQNKVDEKTGEVIEVKICTPRPWLRSLYLAVASLGAPPDVTEADASEAPGPIRWFVQAVSGTLSVATTAISWTIRKTGSMFYGDTDENIEESMAKVPEPAVGRMTRGILGTAFYGLTAGAAIILSGAGFWVPNLAFFTGFVAGEKLVKKFKRWWNSESKTGDKAEVPGGRVPVKEPETNILPEPSTSQITLEDLRSNKDVKKTESSAPKIDMQQLAAAVNATVNPERATAPPTPPAPKVPVVIVPPPPPK